MILISIILVGILSFSKTISFEGRNHDTKSYQLDSIAPKPEPNIKLLFTGDIMLARDVGDKIETENDPDWPFRKIAGFLSRAEITFGNLETTISSRGYKTGSIYSFRSDPSVVEGLKLAGFDVVSLANNHIFDFSSQALTDTEDILDANGIEHVGAGRNYQDANQIVIKNINEFKVGFVAYTDLLPENLIAGNNRPGLSDFNEANILSSIAQAKKEVDFLIVSFHKGIEYKIASDISQQILYHKLIDVGADMVVGHHPHVVQEIEKYNGKYIAYSLGNFVFDQTFSEETMTGLVFGVEIDPVQKSVISTEEYKIRIGINFQPELIE